MQEDQEQKRNVMLFFAISLVIMLGYPYVFKSSTQNQINVTDQNVAAVSHVLENSTQNLYEKSHAAIQQAEVKTIKIKAPRLSGTLSTKGLKFNNINLNDYTKQYDSSEKVSVFGKDNYFAFSGWSSDDKSLVLPDENTCWETDGTELAPRSPVVLTWNNGHGLIFTKKISVDDNFVFTITDKVKNLQIQIIFYSFLNEKILSLSKF